MAEVTVSVDEEGAIQDVGAAGTGERRETSATDVPPAPAAPPTPVLPPVLDEQFPSLPPSPSPSLPSAPPLAGAPRREAPVTRPITRDEWVQDDDYWDTQSLIAVSGRMAVPRPKPRPLEPPQRFQPVRRWQSFAALLVLSAVILATCVGLMRAAGFANNLLRQPRAVPTLTQPTSSPTQPPSPTAKPHSK